MICIPPALVAVLLFVSGGAVAGNAAPVSGGWLLTGWDFGFQEELRIVPEDTTLRPRHAICPKSLALPAPFRVMEL
ncbi:MAG: hypothetical protein V2A77_02210 [Pseudomonadota bacterium]